MNIPQFTAAASLYRTNNPFRYPEQRGEPEGPGVMPQLGGRGFKGFTGCLMDCEDKHPNWSTEQCAKTCRDPFAGADLSTPGNWLNNLLSRGGIDFFEAACRINPYSGSVPFLCGALANEMRRQT